MFSCYCPPGYAGQLCQHDLSTSAGRVSTASFTGNSFLTVLTPEDAVSRISIEFDFRTFAHDGVILYNEGDAGGENDFMSIAIKDK